MKKVLTFILIIISLFVVSSCNKEEPPIEGDFEDNKVIVCLTKEETFLFKEYSASDFSEVNATSVAVLTFGATELAKKQALAEQTGDYSEIQEHVDKNMLLNLDAFRTTLLITLDRRSKENVLSAIEILNRRDDVEFAEPDYRLYPTY